MYILVFPISRYFPFFEKREIKLYFSRILKGLKKKRITFKSIQKKKIFFFASNSHKNCQVKEINVNL